MFVAVGSSSFTLASSLDQLKRCRRCLRRLVAVPRQLHTAAIEIQTKVAILNIRDSFSCDPSGLLKLQTFVVGFLTLFITRDTYVVYMSSIVLYHHTTQPQPFYGPFCGTTQMSRCQKRTWTLWCKGRLTEADTPTIQLGATLSGLSSAHLQHPI